MAKIEEHPLFLAQLKLHEGERRDKVGRHVAYKCPAGKLTIGWGHNLEANPISNDWFSDGEKPKVGSVITNAAAEDLLKSDVAACARELDLYYFSWRSLEEPRQAVLLNMCFNMGWPTLKTFKGMFAAIKDKSWRAAAAEMQDSRWFRQTKKRARELSLQMYLGQWIGADGKPVVLPEVNDG